MGTGRDGGGEKSHQELLRNHVIPVAEGRRLLSHAGSAEFSSVRGTLVSTGLGQTSLCGRACLHICNLCGDVVALISSAVLFFLASGEYAFVRLHDASLDGGYAVARWSGVAGHEVRVG